jgi:hypothetical protein
MDVVKIKREHTSVSISKEHKKRLGRYSKQQGKSRKKVLEYLISYGIYHDLNVSLPLPKTRLKNPVTLENFTNLEKQVEGVIIKTLRAFQTADSYKDDTIKRLNDRLADVVKRKDEDYWQVVQQWNESILLAKDLKKQLAELNQPK